MDSIKSLMDKREYELVIKLTEKSSNVDDIFFRISAFLAIGKGEEALKCLNCNQKILQTRLTLLIKIHIELLCLLGMFDEAYETLEYYKNLPYESQEVEEILNSLPIMIREEERDYFKKEEITDEQIKNKMLSKNKNEVLHGINLSNSRDISLFFNEYKKVLVDFPEQAIRSFALMSLVQKGVQKEFDFLSHRGVIKVVPKMLIPPFVGDPFNRVCHRISNEYKNPSLSENAIQIFSSYIIEIFPDKVEIEDDYIVGTLFLLSSKCLGLDDIDNNDEYCKKHNLDIKRFNIYYNLFDKIVSKF